MSGPSILVTFAVNAEARPFRSELSPASHTEILLTGIGPTSTRRVFLNRLQEPPPKLVITSGFAGGLNPTLRVGTVVYDTSLAPSLAPPLLNLGAQAGRFHTASRVLTTPPVKARAHRETGADAVEMESGVIQALCADRRIPCAIIRIISDAADDTLPLDFNRCLNAQGHLRWMPFTLRCLRHPATLPGLLRLHRTTRASARHLAAVLLALTDPSAPRPPSSGPVPQEP